MSGGSGNSGGSTGSNNSNNSNNSGASRVSGASGPSGATVPVGGDPRFLAQPRPNQNNTPEMQRLLSATGPVRRR